MENSIQQLSEINIGTKFSLNGYLDIYTKETEFAPCQDSNLRKCKVSFPYYDTVLTAKFVDCQVIVIND